MRLRKIPAATRKANRFVLLGGACLVVEFVTGKDINSAILHAGVRSFVPQRVVCHLLVLSRIDRPVQVDPQDAREERDTGREGHKQEYAQ